jgi:DnaJ-class molecular chaperone
MFALFVSIAIVLSLLVTNSITATAQPQSDMQQQQQQEHKSHYASLEVAPTATPSDIKKAYRRLALKHHPDRNPPSEKDAATARFRLVNEAYEVLIDHVRREQYDAELASGRKQPSAAAYRHGGVPHRSYRDPFSQFNDLFQNDPFFQEAFRDMDDRFAKTFQQQHRTPPVPQKKSWGRWLADCVGIDFQIQTSTTTIGADGRPQTSVSSTSYGGNHRNANSGAAYTSRQSRTVIENGQRVTIQSLEKDGNSIEERYVNRQIVQRLINGQPEQQQQLHGRGEPDL